MARLDPADAALMAKALALLNDKPRFGPRDRRLPFDSYSLAAEISSRLIAAGYKFDDLISDVRNRG